AIDAEMALADRVVRFLEAFGAGARLGLGGGRCASRDNYEAKFGVMVDQYHRVADRAIARGLVVNVHPTSTVDSLVRTKVEYERLVAALDPSLLSLGPDTGHITRGDETALAFVERHRDRITHIHLQDARAGGDFVFMGTGDANLPGVLSRLVAHGYAGWLISEEESAEALNDPRATVRACRQYLRGLGF
ncbi:MAG TPA: TIM barrel protein, partial [Chloroflexota bacterium]|nr:TIM barrel protein [Chloroflexota bacterium]